ncbi:MAG: acylneuraminate cytidylyltransferase [Acidobacteriota bacterium]
MRDLGRVIAHLPARGGSQRVPAKNLRLMVGEPMLAYALRAALASERLPEVYVNTESPEIAALGEHLGAKVYKRSAELASDKATSDHFNMDIIEGLAPDTLVMINPVCPLLRPQEIDDALAAYESSTADTLITVSETQMQTFCDGKPVNIRPDELLAATQDNPVVSICNWAVTIWDCAAFKERYRRLGYASFGRQRLLHPIDPLRAVKVSIETDFALCERLIPALREDNRGSAGEESVPAYWSPPETP